MATINPTPIPDAPPAPDRGDRSTFAGRSEAWVTYQKDQLIPAMNQLAADTYTNAEEAAGSAESSASSASTATTAASTATTKADEASTSATNAAAALLEYDKRNLGDHPSDPTTDNQGQPLQVGAQYFKTTPTVGMRVWNGSAWQVAGVPGTGILGPGSSTDGNLPVFDGTGGNLLRDSGVPIAGLGLVGYSARTSNTQLAAADKGKLIDITSGTFSQTIASAAALGAGWWCYLRNSGSGDITLDPDGAETIDGLSSFVMYPGECRLLMCDGTALRSIVLTAFRRTYTASGAFTKPPGYARFGVKLTGGGGGGGRSGNASYYAGGGGGGACVIDTLDASVLGASEAVTIGAGGTAGVGSSNGGNGGSSTFSVLTGYGGGGGGGNGSANRSGGGGAGINGAGAAGAAAAVAGGAPTANSTDNDNAGFGGGRGALSGIGGHAAYGGGGGGSGAAAGGNSIHGGGGGGGGHSTSGGAAGTSKFAGNGGAGSSSGAATAATAPGGGGGGTCTGTATAGERGELQIWGIV